MKAIVNAKIHTMENNIIEKGYILIDNKKISEVGDMSEFKDSDFEIIDANGKTVTPGLVDAHTHIGIWNDGLRFEGADGNEEYDPITPNLRAFDGINAMDRCFSEALEGGVTTAIVSPGSANPIGGQVLAMKTMGRRIDDMIIKAPLAIKIAFGENPKSVYSEKNQGPSTRMTTAALIRENFEKAKEYERAWNEYNEEPEEGDRPDIDVKLEALVPAIKGDIQVHAHVHRADDIFTAIRIAKEFNLDLVLVHCTEGYMIAKELKKEGYPILLGPVLTDRCKPELVNQDIHAGAVLENNGLDISIITDHPETPIQYINLCAGVMVREGMSCEMALKAMTINPAKAVKLDDRIGSIKCGKDADIVIWDGDPIGIMSKPWKVFCGGIEFSK